MLKATDLEIGSVYYHKLEGIPLVYLGDMSVTKEPAYYFRYLDINMQFQSSGFLLAEIEDKEPPENYNFLNETEVEWLSIQRECVEQERLTQNGRLDKCLTPIKGER
jgi:hypothetical protein